MLVVANPINEWSIQQFWQGINSVKRVEVTGATICFGSQTVSLPRARITAHLPKIPARLVDAISVAYMMSRLWLSPYWSSVGLFLKSVYRLALGHQWAPAIVHLGSLRHQYRFVTDQSLKPPLKDEGTKGANQKKRRGMTGFCENMLTGQLGWPQDLM